ncbi:hypothetical protein [Stygiolobus caldivivus]|uniref:Uncharacterized protein n=1 Tax=Stygiolobus caldivivus TaxID=2824673 RepID=A0A8D5ZDT2_9CREN|nr:hypothetical protein [Stygiolobus caldivivus]BCU69283.1 hypothetical protein KN1_05800 [Stygiolobus caldivivus]
MQSKDFVIPVYASGFFNFSSDGQVTQFTTFYYLDRRGYYLSLGKRRLKEELKTIKNNLQAIIDEEEIRINGKRVRAYVKWVKIKLLDPHHPMIEFIITFTGSLKKGINEYYNTYEEEIAEYPYEALWILPGRIIKVDMAGEAEVRENILRLKVNKGTRVGGKEGIRFLIT